MTSRYLPRHKFGSLSGSIFSTVGKPIQESTYSVAIGETYSGFDSAVNSDGYSNIPDPIYLLRYSFRIPGRAYSTRDKPFAGKNS